MSVLDWHKNTYANDQSSVPAQLSQLKLSMFEEILHESIGHCLSDVPLQLWVRIYGGLHLMTKHPQETRTLPGNILYWNVREGDAAKGTIVIRTEKDSEVIVVFLQRTSRELTIEAWENKFARTATRFLGLPHSPVSSTRRKQKVAEDPPGSRTVHLNRRSSYHPSENTTGGDSRKALLHHRYSI